MSIRRGSALKEHAKAVITESLFAKKDFENDKFLLLEGSDDIDVIKHYYMYKGIEVKRVFRLIKADEEGIEGSNKVAGKQNALNFFGKLKEKNRNVICLLDRDYDFYLDEVNSDPKIKYYDYYELENYLFEDTLLMIILKNVCNYPDIESYEKMVTLLHNIEKECKPYILLCFLREVNYRKNILTEEQLNKVLEIIDKKPASMMQMKHLGIENALERITGYIEIELGKVGLNIELVEKIINENDYESSQLMDVSEPLYLFRYAIKGKTISNSIPYFFKYILENNPDLNEFKSKGNLSNLLSRLKIEWIPNSSQDFTKLLEEIEREFELEAVLQNS
ncbi:hypothetical protein [Bacillus cereus]